ncbi:MAG TPA: lysine 5,6-aminomutase subunit alpha, partial [Holophaga sp.]|nr:lysine 5,6-aminomutase subunit alpha [Holophaga sp.]
MEPKLGLPPERIARARELAEQIVSPVQRFIDAHTTVTVERATLRLAGVDGADADGVPVPNLVVDQLKDRLEEGALKYYVNALVRTGEDVQGLNRRIAEGFR